VFRRSRPVQLITAVLATALVSGCGPAAETTTDGGSGERSLAPAELAIVAFSTPQPSYDLITAAFQRTPQGRHITFTTSYGASGDQSRAVAAGLTADIVHFAIETDLSRLVQSGIVAADWSGNSHHGILTDSVLAIGVRLGNPKKIKDWADLIRPGVEVVTPNPFSSGGARWNVLAAYGQVARTGGSVDQGITYLNAILPLIPI